MLIFRGLPPFLRFTTLVGVLCYLTSGVLCGWMLATWLIPYFAAAGNLTRTHLLPMMMNLFLLGIAFTFLTIAYRSHERSPDTTGFPFHSWQEQARTTALLAALPLCAFVLAVVPVDLFAVIISWVVGLVAAGVNLWTLVWMSSWPVDASPG